MENSETMLGWISFALLALWRLYWYITEQKADKSKPKKTETFQLFSKKGISKVVTLLAFGVSGVQLLGVSLLPFPHHYFFLQIAGFILVVTGLSIAVIGRRNLGINWANCYEYQIKKNQELVTTGIYRYIRHPLYAGIVLFLIGSQLVVQSYLFFFYLIAFVAANQQAKWEEELLVKHFGTTYRSYMKRTKRFIPSIW